jgi:hypothetical protein
MARGASHGWLLSVNCWSGCYVSAEAVCQPVLMSGNLVTKLVQLLRKRTHKGGSSSPCGHLTQAAAIHPSRTQVQNTDFSATFGGKSQKCTVVVRCLPGRRRQAGDRTRQPTYHQNPQS